MKLYEDRANRSGERGYHGSRSSSPSTQGAGQHQSRSRGKHSNGQYQSGVTELMSDLGGRLDAFERIALRLDRVLASLDVGGDGAAGTALENAAVVTRELADFLT